MYKLVQNLQKKNDSQKRVILVSLTAFSAVVVGGLWLFLMQSKISHKEAFVGPSFTEDAKEDEDRVSIDVERPFDSLKETTLNSFATIKTQLEELKNVADNMDDENSQEQQGGWELPIETQ